MKKLFTIALLIFASVQMFAQIQFNPQIGVSALKFTDAPEGETYKGKVGFSVGADLRFGEKFQIQPGVHYINAVTAIKTEGEAVVNSDVVHKYVKLKALAAYNIIDAEQFKFRLNFGPAYDILLGAKNKDTGDDLKDQFKNGTFFLQGGVGVDILFLTADLGYARGLSKTFNYASAPDSKTAGIYFNVGIVFGKGK